MDRKHRSTAVPGAITEADIIASAMLVFDTYNGFMFTTYGTQYPKRKYHNNKQQWRSCRNIAELCLNNDWDIEVYVREAMSLVSKNNSVMHPKALLAPNIVSKFSDINDEDNISSDPAVMWRYYLQQFKSLSKTYADVDTILYSPLVDLPAWFRVFIGDPLSERVYDFYWVEARKQLNTNRPLRNFLRKIAPRRFSDLEQRWGAFGDYKEQL